MSAPMDRLFANKYFSVLFGIFLFAVPLASTTCAAIGGLVQPNAKWAWITASIILAAVGATLSAIEKRRSSRHEAEAAHVHESNSAIIDSLEYMAEVISNRLDCWDSHTRVTVYAAVRRGGEVVLCPLARRSFNPDLAREGRTFCRTSEGLLSSVWRGLRNGRVTAQFNGPKASRIEWYISKYGMDSRTAEHLTMYPTSMFGARLECNREPVGVLMFENDNEEGEAMFGPEFTDRFENDEVAAEMVEVLQANIYAIRSIVPNLIHHETYHSMPEVDVKDLPEKN